MTRERRDRIEEISNTIVELRNELLELRHAEISELPTLTGTGRIRSSREHIEEIEKATELFREGIVELGYYVFAYPFPQKEELR